MSRIYVFPGQGAQRVGMGAALFDKYERIVRQADDVLGYSIKTLCLHDPDKQLDQTAYTQPALFVVNALSYLEKEAQGLVPDYAAGHSLGEYNALLAAGVFDFVTGLRLVQRRGELMGRARGGGMAAVVGLAEERVRAVLERERLSGIDMANFNSPLQIVISGPREEIEKAEAPLLADGAQHFIALRVSAAFHSRYMIEAEREFAAFLRQVELSPPRFPVLSNVHAAPYEPDQIAETLAAQMSRPVRWTEITRRLMTLESATFEEIGPGNVLTGLMRKIKLEAASLPAPLPLPRPQRPAPSLTAAAPAPSPSLPAITIDALGSADFRRDFGLRYSYLAGSMYRGISCAALVIAMGRAGFMGFFGAGGLGLDRIAAAIDEIRGGLRGDQPFGVNLLHDLNRPELEEAVVELLLQKRVSTIEASAFMQMTPALVRYRAKGLTRRPDGAITIGNRIIAKVSRPEVAQAFMSRAPERLLEQLVASRKLSAAEAELARAVPMCDALTVEADSGGHTDQGVALALVPAMLALRERLARSERLGRTIYLGAAGGIGTPQAIAAAFIMGADYVMSGSINQCTVESGASPAVKTLLQGAEVQDTTMAPAGDMFEIGARVQVLRKGLFFPSRANRLYELYKQHSSLDEIDAATRAQLEKKYFKRSFAEVYDETKRYFATVAPEEIAKAESNPRHKMALVFRWYFAYSARLAREGADEHRVDYQIHCGPALGAFNAYVKGTELEPWQNRRVAHIAEKLMADAARLLHERFTMLTRGTARKIDDAQLGRARKLA